jgi:coenzyme PQQ precursor peptide PqqA
MNWTKPEFEEMALGMEVTGYVNTDVAPPVNQPDRAEPGRCSGQPQAEESKTR